MIKIKKKELNLDLEEYYIGCKHPEAKNYTIYHNGKELTDVTGIIRYGGLNDNA